MGVVETPIKSIYKKKQSLVNLFTPVSMRTSPRHEEKVSVSSSSTSTAQTTSRFSLSKLTKFVSRSALKVMNRKTSTDSLGESLESSSSSDTSILNYEEENNQLKKLSHLREASSHAATVSQSYISPKTKTTFTNSCRMPNRQTEKNRPVMGLTALMLNKHKQQMSNSQQYGFYGMTTGLMMPNMFLVGLPIVFNPACLIDDEKTSGNNNNYDRLTRVNPSTMKTPTPQQTPSIKTNPNQSKSYRMSVFSNKKNSPSSSSSIKQQLSVNNAYEAVF